MTLEHYHDEVVRVRAPLIAGDYNSNVRNWAAATRATFPAAVQAISSSEDVVQQQRTETRWRVFTVPAAGFLATDRAEWDDDSFEVDGDVEMHKRGGVPHHLEFVLKRVKQE